MATLEVARWYCGRCGIVRDTIEQDGEPTAPWYHPNATGALPWGLTDPHAS